MIPCGSEFCGKEEAMRDLFWLSDQAWAALDSAAPAQPTWQAPRR